MQPHITMKNSFPRWALGELNAEPEVMDYLQTFVDRIFKYAVGSFEWTNTKQIIVKVQKGSTFQTKYGTLDGVRGYHKIPCRTYTSGSHQAGGINTADFIEKGGKATVTVNIGTIYYRKYVLMIEKGISHGAAMGMVKGELAQTVFHELTHAHQHDRGSLWFERSANGKKWAHVWEGDKPVVVENLSYNSYLALPWEVEARSRADSLVAGFTRHLKIRNAKSLTFNELESILK
ncbi:hypothetical protein VPHK469_0205 [Vibrio phage K469]